MVGHHSPPELIGDEIADYGTVSVAIASCNGERFIREQIDSILLQTRPVDQIVVSDDCSDDATMEIIQDCLADFEPKLLFRNAKRIGVVGNFERALRACDGDFIALSDQDDIWEPNKIERLLEEIGSASLIYSDYTLIDTGGKPRVETSRERIPYRGVDSSRGDIIGLLIHRSFVHGSTSLLRRDLLQDSLPIPNIQWRWHDWWLAYIAAETQGIRYLPEQLTRYRRHNNNLTLTAVSEAKTRRGTFRRRIANWRDNRRDAASHLLLVTNAMLEANVPLSNADKLQIADARRYAESLLHSDQPRFRLSYSWRHREILWPQTSAAIRACKIASRMLPGDISPARTGGWRALRELM